MDQIPNDVLDKHDALITFLALKDIDEYFPILDKNQKSRVINYLITKAAVFNLKEMKIMDLELNLPENLEVLKNLRKLTMDDYNTNKICQNWDYFAYVENLVIFTSVGLSFAFKNLKKLTVANISSEIKDFDVTIFPNLDFLSLSGFFLEFNQRIPETIVLEDCYVANSKNLPGCKSMTLISTIWKTPSAPSNTLILEETDYYLEVQNLEVLHLNRSNFPGDLKDLLNLKELKYIGSEVRYDDIPTSVERLTYDFEIPIQGKLFSENLKQLFLKGVTNSFNIPVNLEILVLTNSKLNADEIKITKRLKELRIVFSEISGHCLVCNAESVVLKDNVFYNFCEIKDFDRIMSHNCKNIDIDQFNYDLVNMSRKEYLDMCFTESFFLEFSNFPYFVADLDLLKTYDRKKWEIFFEIFTSLKYGKINYTPTAPQWKNIISKISKIC
jgi:hypothetical protein